MRLSTLWCAALVAAMVPGCKKKSSETDQSAAKTTTGETKTGSDMTGSAGTAQMATGSGSAVAEAPKAATPDDLAKRYVECWGFWNQKDWKNMSTCYASNISSEQVDSGMPPMTTADQINAGHQMIATAFPDRKGDLEVTLINGHNGATFALFTGTNSGPMKTPTGEIPPTNKKVGMQMAHAVHFTDDGKAADKEWSYMDMGEMMGQLGLSKAPVRPAVDKPWHDNEIVIAKDDANEKRNLQNTTTGMEAFNKHDTKAMEAMEADSLVWSESGMPKDTNKAETAKSDEAMFKAFPDLKLASDAMWAAGDYVVVQGTMSGTNTGDWKEMGLKKTGKPVSIHFMQLFKYDKDGKLTNSWGYWNSAAFAQQLGMAPPAGGEAKPGAKHDEKAEKKPAKK